MGAPRLGMDLAETAEAPGGGQSPRVSSNLDTWFLHDWRGGPSWWFGAEGLQDGENFFKMWKVNTAGFPSSTKSPRSTGLGPSAVGTLVPRGPGWPTPGLTCAGSRVTTCFLLLPCGTALPPAPHSHCISEISGSLPGVRRPSWDPGRVAQEEGSLQGWDSSLVMGQRSKKMLPEKTCVSLGQSS